MSIKRTAINYNRKAIKRVGRPKIKVRTAITNFKAVKVWDKVFMVDMRPETAVKVHHSIGRRMFVCFGRALGFELSQEVMRSLLPERIEYLKRYRRTINVRNQTLRTMEERNAVLGNVKIYR